MNLVLGCPAVALTAAACCVCIDHTLLLRCLCCGSSLVERDPSMRFDPFPPVESITFSAVRRYVTVVHLYMELS